MIVSFKCSATEKIYSGTRSKKFPSDIQQIARRKLRMLNNAHVLGDLAIPPGNHLEALKGDRTGQFSLRINAKFRICFKWNQGNVSDVEIVDYH
jgi:proteic killer suppression protein